MNKRLLVGLISGAVLGVICIVGASLRSSETLSNTYLFAFWYNRLMIGLVIGLLQKNTLKIYVLKGVVIGILISIAFYSSTNFQDVVGFIAGIVYGAIIPLVIYFAIDYKKEH